MSDQSYGESFCSHWNAKLSSPKHLLIHVMGPCAGHTRGPPLTLSDPTNTTRVVSILADYL